MCLLASIILSSVKPEMGEKRHLISKVSSGQNYSIIEGTLCQYLGSGLERSKTGKMTKKSLKIIFKPSKQLKIDGQKVIIQLYLREKCSDRTDIHDGTNSPAVF